MTRPRPVLPLLLASLILTPTATTTATLSADATRTPHASALADDERRHCC
jgi:hypothetical protein